MNAKRHSGAVAVYLAVKNGKSLTFSSLLCAASQTPGCISMGFSLRQSGSQLAYLAIGNIDIDVVVVVPVQGDRPCELKTVPLYRVT